MSSTYPTSFNAPNQILNVSEVVVRPCLAVPPVIVSYFYGSQTGWNAVLVGLLSSVLAILFLLTCLYYLAFRRRYREQDVSSSSTPVALVDKKGASSIPVTTSSQTATTTFINETGKETKLNTYTEQTSGSTAAGNFVGMPMLGNGHTGTSNTNGLLANGSADPSELRLLQHEHH